MLLSIREEGIPILKRKLGRIVTLEAEAYFVEPESLSNLSVQSRARVNVDGTELKLSFIEIAQCFHIYELENE